MVNWNEIDLFNWLRDNIYFDLEKAKNPMSKWDCYSLNKNHRIELKCRKKHYNTLLIEKKKYDSMIEKCIQNGETPMYINSTPNGIYFFDLRLINPDWEFNTKNPATTYFAHTERIEKEVAYLEISKAIKVCKIKL